MNIAKVNTAYDGGLILNTGSGGGNSGGGGSTGGGSTSVNDVTFYDYDGTVLYAYTKKDFLKLRELPALPTREGLICQEWNYSIEDAKEYVQEHGKLDIGATYITDDGKTRFYIKVEGERKSFPFMFFISEANSLVIDWGDGATESISGSGSLNVSHTYDKVGDYIISFDVAEGAKLSFSGSNSSGIITEPYTIMLSKLEIGNRTSIGSYAFNKCYSLSSVVIPNSVTSIKGNAFYNCTCVALFDFRTHTTVPTLSSSSTFSGIASDCKIVVPDALYDEWIAATNWSTYASQIVKASEFNG